MPAPKPLPESIRQRLGTVPDAHLAREAGCSEVHIRRARGAIAPSEPAAVPRESPRLVRTFRATEEEYAPVRAYMAAHGCGDSDAIRALIGLQPT